MLLLGVMSYRLWHYLRATSWCKATEAYLIAIVN